VRAAEQLPGEFRIDELLERMIIIQKVEEAQQRLDTGKGISHADVAKHLREILNVQSSNQVLGFGVT